MGYYIRVLATDDTPLSEQELRECLPVTPDSELIVEGKDESGWLQLVLRHADGPEIAAIERNLVIPGELGESEITEFVEEVKVGRPQSAGRWLERYLPRVKAIYAFQLLSGTDVQDGWAAVRGIQTCIWRGRGGILQADGEGFSNEDGDLILWQFADTVDGDWNMAVLDKDGNWIRFQMNLGDPEQRAAFLKGRVPEGAKIL
jgi:hypothetical protein